MKKIITISREFGASGGTIGKAVADRLGYEYYDKEIILQSARESNLDIASLEKWDEKIPVNFGFAQSLFDFYNKPLNEKLFDAQKRVIRKIGEKEIVSLSDVMQIQSLANMTVHCIFLFMRILIGDYSI